MSLHDTDKNSNTRLNPTPNQNDQVLQRMANGTTSVHATTQDAGVSGYLKTRDGQIIANDGTNNIGLFGFDSTGAMVVKVAETGYDADTAADSNLIFNSGQNIFKIVQSGTISISPFTTADGNQNSGSNTVTHGLGFVPVVLAFKQGTSGQYLGLWSETRLLGYTSSSGAPLSIKGIEFQTMNISTSDVTFTDTVILSQYSSSFTTPTYNIRYYILQETAS